MTDFDLCPICGGFEESLFHVFRDCNRIKNLWNGLIIPKPREFFMSSNWINWLEINLHRGKNIENNNWHITFGTILDSIWRARNDFVFNGKSINFTSILHRAQDLGEQVLKNFALFRKLRPSLLNCADLPPICWSPPPMGF